MRCLNALVFVFAASIASVVNTPASAEESLYDWSGFYGGVHIGAGSGNTDVVDLDGGFFTFRPGQRFEFDGNGLVLGAHIGAQYQADGFLFGLEASASHSKIDDRIVSPFFPGSDTLELKQDFLLTATARIGYAIDRWLVYAKGGYAGTEFKLSAFDSFNNTGFATKEWHNGYVLGGGFEYAVTRNVSFGIDYSRLEFDAEVHNGATPGNFGLFPENHRVDPAAEHVVSARISFKFGH